MISTKLMIVMLIVYILITIVAACEHRWPLSLYFFGAAVLMVGVLWGMK